MFGLGMRDFLADIGGIFLVATALCLIGCYMDTGTDADAQRFSDQQPNGIRAAPAQPC